MYYTEKIEDEHSLISLTRFDKEALYLEILDYSTREVIFDADNEKWIDELRKDLAAGITDSDHVQEAAKAVNDSLGEMLVLNAILTTAKERGWF